MTNTRMTQEQPLSATVMIRAKGVCGSELCEKIGQPDRLKQTKAGCIWSKDYKLPDNKNSAEAAIQYTLAQLSKYKHELKALRDNGSELSITLLGNFKNATMLSYASIKTLFEFGFDFNNPETTPNELNSQKKCNL